MLPKAKNASAKHFLTDQPSSVEFVDAIAPKPGQTIVEIGPGPGALTAPPRACRSFAPP